MTITITTCTIAPLSITRPIKIPRSSSTSRWAYRTSSSPRPRPSRNSSLQHALHSQRGSPSIFGSGPSQASTMDEQQEQQQDSGAERPTFAVHPPSQEHTPISQPPLSTLAPEIRRSGSWYEEEERNLVGRRRLPQVEKDADDPTAAPSSSRSGLHRRESTTLTTLTRLFAVQAPVGSPEASRSSSYIQASQASADLHSQSAVRDGCLARPFVPPRLDGG